MMNILKLAADVMDELSIGFTASNVKFDTTESKEIITTITSDPEYSFELDWRDDRIDEFLKKHPTVKIFLEDKCTLKIIVPEYYIGVGYIYDDDGEELTPVSTKTTDLPGNVRQIEIDFGGSIGIPGIKYYAVAAGLVELEDTDFSLEGDNSVVCRYYGKRAVSISSHWRPNKMAHIYRITIIDHRIIK